MQVVDTNTGKPPPTNPNLQIAAMMGLSDVLDQLGEKVRANRIRSMQQAQIVFEDDCDRLRRLYPGMTTTVSIVPAESKP
jgi:hypothetical protein